MNFQPNNYRGNFLFVIGMLLLGSTAGRAEEKWDRVINLEGKWKFSIGDNTRWSDKYYNDLSWESIEVPSKWEDEGFNGYNGYAWYRKAFNGQDLRDQALGYFLFLGYIDDVDEVYFNGHKIGSSGSFPPRFQTAYNAQRHYYIPKEYIDFTGRNLIAVKVYDAEIEGGIVSGDIGIYSSRSDAGLTVNLRGVWNFKVTGARGGTKFSTDEKWINDPVSMSGAGWVELMVPGIWENQGFHDYDGGAWYQKKFTIPKQLAGEDLVLILGKIDDSDKTFLNGKLVGSTINQYDKIRIYHISADHVKVGEPNVLMIYVEDLQGEGGFTEGPVGLMKQSDFTRYIRWK